MTVVGKLMRAEPPSWLRGGARLDNGWIVQDPAKARTYNPLEEAGLPLALAALEEPEDAVAFAQRFGLLRHGPGAEDLREPWEEWKQQRDFIRIPLLLYEAIARAVQGRSDAVEELRDRQQAIERLFPEPTETDAQLVAKASKAVAWLTSEGLEGTDYRVNAAVDWDEAGAPDDFWLSAHPKDLMGYVYFQLAMLITDSVPMGRCAECRHVYVITDGRQQFCTPVCANRARYRRWAAKNKRVSPHS